MCNIVVIIAVAFLHLPCATIWQNFWGEGMAEVILDYIFFLLDTRPYDPLHTNCHHDGQTHAHIWAPAYKTRGKRRVENK